jgi:hypothetical protein
MSGKTYACFDFCPPRLRTRSDAKSSSIDSKHLQDQAMKPCHTYGVVRTFQGASTLVTSTSMLCRTCMQPCSVSGILIFHGLYGSTPFASIKRTARRKVIKFGSWHAFTAKQFECSFGLASRPMIVTEHSKPSAPGSSLLGINTRRKKLHVRSRCYSSGIGFSESGYDNERSLSLNGQV